MRNFHIAKTNGYSLTHEQEYFLELTFSKLAGSNEDMATTLDNVEIHLEGSAFRKMTIEDPESHIKGLEELQARLQEELHDCIKNNMNKEVIGRIEKALGDVGMSIMVLRNLNDRYYEEMILGSYHYDNTIGKGVITLYVDNLKKTANSLSNRFQRNGLEQLTGYVFVHEAYHAYYDVDHSRTVVSEIEEPMAEFGALTFLKNNGLPNFDLALHEVSQKKYSPCWTSAYGFGEYLFNNPIKLLGELYRGNSNTVMSSYQKVVQYKKGFEFGYPWKDETFYFNILLHLISKHLKMSVRSSSRTQKYYYNGTWYCKRRLVLAIIKDYASKYDINQVKAIFDPVKNGNRQVVKKYSTLTHRRPDDFRRYFVDVHERIIDIAFPYDEYVVDNQWGAGSEFDQFLLTAKTLGYKIY